jgi:hypothetical protein
MKTKHTNIGLSLLVIVTALTFGMGGASAKGELIQLKKSLKGEIWYNGGWGESEWNNFPKAPLGTINLSEGEEITMLKLLSHGSKNRFPGAQGQQHSYIRCSIVIKIKYPQFEEPTELRYASKQNNIGNWHWHLEGGQSRITGEAFPVYGPATVEVVANPNRAYYGGNNDYQFVIEQQVIQVLMKKERSAFAQSPTQLQALVLPKNTKNTRLVVESSEDLVNWAIDTPGPKTTTNRERFFRLRAVKE